MIENKKKNLFEKIIRSSWFGPICILLTVVLNAIIASIKKDWTWAIVTIIVLVVLLFLMYFLSILMRKEREDIMQHIIKKDSVLDTYLTERINEFMHSGNHLSNVHSCLSNVQQECEKRLAQNFLKKEYEAIPFKTFREILELEKAVDNGEIWIVTDNISTDVNNEEVYQTVSLNIKDGTTYHYFYNKQDGAADAIKIIKDDLKDEFKIEDIDNKIGFIPVGVDYNALLTMAKDVIILQPNKRKERQAFLCIYASENFEIAFYRKLNDKETNILCDMIRKLLPKKPLK
jgi:hypothetical protein